MAALLVTGQWQAEVQEALSLVSLHFSSGEVEGQAYYPYGHLL